MREKVVTFGNESRMIGVITEPDASPMNEQGSAVLLWNAGLLHRVGPYRLFVDLARKIASMGFHVLRFDLSGKGDSETSRGVNLETERAVLDIQCAMDYLSEKKRIREFILLGLCSGADEAFPTAVRDSRVSGVVLLDAFGYRTVRFYFHFYGRRFIRSWFKVSKWKKLIGSAYIGIWSRICSEDRPEIIYRDFPSKNEARRHCLQLIDRGVRLLFVYTSGVESYYCYSRQFWDMLQLNVDGFKDNLQVVYFKDSDHIYTLVEDRKLLMKTICGWMQAQFRTVLGRN